MKPFNQINERRMNLPPIGSRTSTRTLPSEIASPPPRNLQVWFAEKAFTKGLSPRGAAPEVKTNSPDQNRKFPQPQCCKFGSRTRLSEGGHILGDLPPNRKRSHGPKSQHFSNYFEGRTAYGVCPMLAWFKVRIN